MLAITFGLPPYDVDRFRKEKGWGEEKDSVEKMI